MARLRVILLFNLHWYAIYHVCILLFFLPPMAKERRKTIWSELESNPGPLASQATTLTTRPCLLVLFLLRCKSWSQHFNPHLIFQSSCQRHFSEISIRVRIFCSGWPVRFIPERSFERGTDEPGASGTSQAPISIGVDQHARRAAELRRNHGFDSRQSNLPDHPSPQL